MLPFHDDHVRRHDFVRVRDAAMRNLRRVRAEEHTEHTGVHRLFGGAHVAAGALVLDEVIGRTTGERELPYGALVAVPTRDTLLYHVPRGTDLADAMMAMNELAIHPLGESPLDVLSPLVFWWRDGSFVPLSHIDRNGMADWSMPPEFAELYQRLMTEKP